MLNQQGKIFNFYFIFVKKTKSMSKESKRDRFLRIKGTRLLNLQVALVRVGKLANKEHFELTKQDKEELFTEIDKQVQETKNLF